MATSAEIPPEQGGRPSGGQDDKQGRHIGGRLFIARHGETVFNAARRMQGNRQLHTPLTRAGFAQADGMGAALAAWLAADARANMAVRPMELHASSAGRALQTIAVMAEHIGQDWHGAAVDDRLQEIDVGDWTGRYYPDLTAEIGPFICERSGLFTRVAPGGESYADVAARLTDWLAALSTSSAAPQGEVAPDRLPDRLVVMHGMSSRVLRGLLLGLDPDPRFNTPIAAGVPQGSFVMIDDNQLNDNGKLSETLIHLNPAGQVE